MNWKEFKDSVESQGITDNMSLGDGIVCFSLDNIQVSIHDEKDMTFACIY